MPGTVQDLSRKLLNAIDPEGNVTDMGIVLEVVEALEGITITADDLRTNRLGKNINQLRRKLADSHKSLAKRLKKLVKTWQQLLQSQTPNGLTAPSLGGGNSSNKAEQPLTNLHVRSSTVDSRRRSVSSSREGTPSQSVGEPLVNKSDPLSHKNASCTPPSPLPSSLTLSSSTSSSSTTPAPPPAPAPQQPPVIPRPTKAQDFARNRMRRMQMFSAVKKPAVAHVAPQSHQPPASTQDQQIHQQPQPQQQQQQQPGAETTPTQSLSQQQISPPVSSTYNSISKMSSFVSQNEPYSASLSVNPISNGNNLLKSPQSLAHVPSPTHSPPKSLSLSQLSSNVKLLNTHPPPITSLSQMVTNSFNQKVPSTDSQPEPFKLTSSTTVSQTSIAHKIGVKSSEGKNSHKHPETLPPDSLVVRIPRNLVHINSALNRTLGLSDKDKVKGLNDHSAETGRSSRPLQMHETELSLTVSIDVSLLNRGRSASSSWQSQTGLDIKPNRTEQVVENHCPSEEMESLSTYHGHQDAEDCEPMETGASPLFGNGEIPLTKPQNKLIPSGASPGVDGCMGNDGYWYAWTDMIPGHDEAVTVLPYIYIDNESDSGNGVDLL